MLGKPTASLAREGRCMMPENKRIGTRLQLWVAVGLCVFGVSLLAIAFFVRPPGEIHSSVLVAYGEVMTFAGALFGIDYHYHR